MVGYLFKNSTPSIAQVTTSYSTGTWTPGLTLNTTNQPVFSGGVYTKFGNVVVADFALLTTGVSSASGSGTLITGLPFIATTDNVGHGSISHYSGMVGLTGAFVLQLQGGTQTLAVRQSSATGIANLSGSHFTTSTQLFGGVTYYTTQ